MFSAPARDYMSRSLISVHPETPLDQVAQILAERDISCVIVLDDVGAPCGIVSSTDLLRDALREMSQSSRDAVPRLARDVMSTSIIGIDEGQSVREAAEAMGIHRIHRVLVSRDDQPVAVLSTRDVMRVIVARKLSLPLSAVMTAAVETIDVGQSVRAALAQLGEKSVRGLVVTDEDFPVGVFSEVEALKARALPASFLAIPVEEAMSYAMLCLDQSTPLYRVAGYAQATRARRILAVKDRRLTGIATGFDLARAATMG
jgi:CBS domain-containing protein